ncbi:MAG: anthranilate phosphoribosyltransferase [Spirochaetes bacterium]|nr:anthranilate phosphoribosyltransferase [Spirochaetota bacterium]
MDRLVKKINSGEKLSFDEAQELFDSMVLGSLSEPQIASALIAMKLRHETVDELAALAVTLDRHKKRLAPGTNDTVDTCGTGGDGKSTANISTASSVILSAMGARVVKHGNTAQSGVVGSADILTGLGMDLDYAGSSPEEFFARHGYVFMLAPKYHPALKGIGKVRRELKVPTIFNFVGPLINPADPTYQVIGISRKDRLEFIAQVIGKIGKRNITVYASRDGFDEVSSRDTTECIFIGDGGNRRFSIDPSEFFEPFDMPVVKNMDDAKKLFVGGLTGDDKQMAALFSLNAALALRTMGQYGLQEGYALAKERIADGTVGRKLEELLGAAVTREAAV